MIVHQRRKNASHQPEPDPNCLAFDEKVNVAMAVACVRAGAEKHHDADDEQSQHRQKQDVGTLTTHRLNSSLQLGCRVERSETSLVCIAGGN